MELKINSNKVKPLIILAPLDWGLGHTTRCIPIIKELLVNNCRVIVACNSTQMGILQKDFPHIQFVEIEGYNITYGKTRLKTFFSLFFQISKLLMSVKSERRWLARFLQHNAAHAVISDNRYGFYSRNIPSILITHQLYVKTGAGKLFNRLISSQILRWINHFQACWVPDLRERDAIAGELSNPIIMPKIPVYYIGCLSRFAQCDQMIESIPLLIVLSGPEPQRTILESILISQLKELDIEAVFVRGVTTKSNPLQDTKKIRFYDLMAGENLRKLVCSANIIICRSGYTSLMDYLKLKKRMILVPTPGQSEQEYLAARLHAKQLALCVPQDSFKLVSAIKMAAEFPYQTLDLETLKYKEVIKRFVDSITPHTVRSE